MNRSLENKYNPDVVSPPGDTLQEVLDSLGMSQKNLAERMGRPYKTINEIINAKAAITPETAIQLEKVLEIPASFWNNRERHYREYLARYIEREEMSSNLAWMDNFPLNEMIRYKWINKHDDKVSQLEALLTFFGLASPNQWGVVWKDLGILYRKSGSTKNNILFLLSAWLRKGELEAKEIKCNVYSDREFRNNLSKIRELTNEVPDNFVPAMTDYCASSGVALVFVPELKGMGVWGATRFTSNNTAILQISLRYKTNDHLWFTFFHEAAHILLHGKKRSFIERGANLDEFENEANEFACNFLIPQHKYEKFVTEGNFSKLSIKKFAQNISIAPGIVVGRLQHDNYLQFSHHNDLKVKYDWR